MYRLLISLLIFGLVTAKFNDQVQRTRKGKVIGGTVTQHSKVPYQVVISVNSTKNFICGGSILDDYHVISAAHCFINHETAPYPWEEGSYLVIAGASELKDDDSSKWVNASVSEIYVPQLYHDSLFNAQHFPTVGDIAVLKLETSLDLAKNDHLRAVQLPKNPEISYADEKAVVSGYGASEVYATSLEVKYTYDDKLRYANTKVLSNFNCQNIWFSFAIKSGNKYRRIKDKHICAQLVQKSDQFPEGVCAGDSGGPLVYNGDVLIGVSNTLGFGCKENEVPAQYARVSSFLDFIEKVKQLKDNFNDPEIRSRQPKSFFDLSDNAIV